MKRLFLKTAFIITASFSLKRVKYIKNYFCFLSLIFLLFLQSQAQAIKTGLVLYLPFDNDFNDYSISNLTGVPSPSPNRPTIIKVSNVKGYECESPCIESCQDANTTDPLICWVKSYARMPNENGSIVVSSYQNKIDFTNNFTISLWIKFGKSRSNAVIFGLEPDKGNILSTTHDNNFSPVNEGLSMSYDFSSTQHMITFVAFIPNYSGNNQIISRSIMLLQSCCYGTTNPNTVQNFRDNKWHQLTITFDKSTSSANMYVDNVLAQSKSVDAFNNAKLNSYPLIFGRDNSLSKFSVGGLSLDNVKIYNRALSTTELTILNKDTLDVPTGIELPLNFEKVKVFPNPTNDVLNISLRNPSPNYTIKITNSTSQTLFTTQLTTSSYQLNLNTLGAKGLYFIQILDNTNKVLETKKLVLE